MITELTNLLLLGKQFLVKEKEKGDANPKREKQENVKIKENAQEKLKEKEKLSEKNDQEEKINYFFK